MGANDENPSLADRRFELFKFYEEASQRTKTDAWTQTTWVLTLSGAILAFSVELYLEHSDRAGFSTITWSCAGAGLVLTAYLMYVLHQLAKHIRNYWTAANRLAAADPFLHRYISSKDASKAVEDSYEADYPAFVLRLNIPPLLFAAGHIAWALHAGRSVVG